MRQNTTWQSIRLKKTKIFHILNRHNTSILYEWLFTYSTLQYMYCTVNTNFDSVADCCRRFMACLAVESSKDCSSLSNLVFSASSLDISSSLPEKYYSIGPEMFSLYSPSDIPFLAHKEDIFPSINTLFLHLQRNSYSSHQGSLAPFSLSTSSCIRIASSSPLPSLHTSTFLQHFQLQ